MAFKNSQIKFERDEKSLRAQEPIIVEEINNPELAKSAEWKKLKEIQRHERDVFFAEGKMAFSELRNSIYREVREEFRGRWADYYDAKKNGGEEDALARMKAELVADQKTILDGRRDEACKELRTERDGQYRELLGDQSDVRASLRARQAAGFENSLFLQLIDEGAMRRDRPESDREVSDVAADRDVPMEQPASAYVSTREPRDNSRMKSGADVAANLGTGLGFSAISFFESLADGFVGAIPDPKPRQAEASPPRGHLFDTAAADAAKRHQAEQEEADAERRKRERSYGE
jgi:hypothetical protein